MGQKRGGETAQDQSAGKQILFRGIFSEEISKNGLKILLQSI